MIEQLSFHSPYMHMRENIKYYFESKLSSGMYVCKSLKRRIFLSLILFDSRVIYFNGIIIKKLKHIHDRQVYE